MSIINKVLSKINEGGPTTRNQVVNGLELILASTRVKRGRSIDDAAPLESYTENDSKTAKLVLDALKASKDPTICAIQDYMSEGTKPINGFKPVKQIALNSKTQEFRGLRTTFYEYTVGTYKGVTLVQKATYFVNDSTELDKSKLTGKYDQFYKYWLREESARELGFTHFSKFLFSPKSISY